MDTAKLILIFFLIFFYPHLMDATTNEDRRSNGGACDGEKYCEDDEYCSANKCVKKTPDGDACLIDNRCVSGHCYYFKCKARQAKKDVEANGVCTGHDDCRFEQYCSKNTCRDRKIQGWCFYDAHCLSNNCFFFRCAKYY